MASYMLTEEESLPQNEQEMINYIEDAEQAKGVACDETFKLLSKEQQEEVLKEARKLRKNKKKKIKTDNEQEETKEEEAEIVASNSE